MTSGRLAGFVGVDAGEVEGYRIELIISIRKHGLYLATPCIWWLSVLIRAAHGGGKDYWNKCIHNYLLLNINSRTVVWAWCWHLPGILFHGSGQVDNQSRTDGTSCVPRWEPCFSQTHPGMGLASCWSWARTIWLLPGPNSCMCFTRQHHNLTKCLVCSKPQFNKVFLANTSHTFPYFPALICSWEPCFSQGDAVLSTVYPQTWGVWGCLWWWKLPAPTGLSNHCPWWRAEG